MSSLPDRLSLLRFAPRVEELAPSRLVDLPTVCVHTNAGEVDDGGVTRARLQGLYHARQVQLDPIGLVALSPGTTVIGNHSYLVLTDNVLIEDQIWPGMHDSPEVLGKLLAAPLGLVQIDDPVLLIARWGAVSVWGHWLGELLPKVVMAEQAHPGRFRYAIPIDIVRRTAERSFSTAVLESLAAYGIGEDRILALDHRFNHRFAQLFAMTPVWSHVAMHPAALGAMRSRVQGVPASRAGKRLGLLRRDVRTRNVFNADETIEVLEQAGFGLVEMGHVSFVEQVAAFREAEAVFGVLGSGLPGLIYSPDGVRAMRVAPANWRDVFFHALLQARSGLYSDVLGTPLWDGDGVDRDAPFFLRRRDILSGLERIMLPEPELAPRGLVHVCGLVLPRLLTRATVDFDFRVGPNTVSRREDGWADPGGGEPAGAAGAGGVGADAAGAGAVDVAGAAAPGVAAAAGQRGRRRAGADRGRGGGDVQRRAAAGVRARRAAGVPLPPSDRDLAARPRREPGRAAPGDLVPPAQGQAASRLGSKARGAAPGFRGRLAFGNLDLGLGQPPHVCGSGGAVPSGSRAEPWPSLRASGGTNSGAVSQGNSTQVSCGTSATQVSASARPAGLAYRQAKWASGRISRTRRAVPPVSTRSSTIRKPSPVPAAAGALSRVGVPRSSSS